MSLVARERAALCDLLETVGPLAPTVLPGWDVGDLLAHLLVRERNPLAAPGILFKPLASVADAAMRSYTARPWPELVQRFRDGPPLWSPYRIPLLEEKANLVEFFVHYEDVARAAPDWRPRPPGRERDEALWSVLRIGGWALYRNCPVGVVLRRPGGEEHVVRSATPSVTVTGEPGELVLHGFGRPVVQVEADGSAEDIAALTASARGI